MLQNLNIDIRDCYLLAEQCRQWAELAPTPSAKTRYLNIELLKDQMKGAITA